MGLLSAVILLGILIFVHELGHFIFAKLLGFKVEKFSLGFGPRIIGKKIGETDYMISAVPLGGYVKMYGAESMIEGEDADEKDVSEEDRKRGFNKQSVLKRFLVISSGPVFNIVFAAFVFFMIFFFYGMPDLLPKIGEVHKNTPAALAGLQNGDIITGIDGHAVNTWSEMTSLIRGAADKELAFKIDRGGQSLEFKIMPEKKIEKNIFGEYVSIGIIGIKPSGDTIVNKMGIFDSLNTAIVKTIEAMGLIFVVMAKLIQGAIPAKTLGGPIMIVQMASESASHGVLEFFYLMSIISINLGIFNLLPVPVLDGGHLVFLGIEAVRKKPLSPRVMLNAMRVGIALLVILIVFVFYNDIGRLISGQNIMAP